MCAYPFVVQTMLRKQHLVKRLPDLISSLIDASYKHLLQHVLRSVLPDQPISARCE